MGDAPMEIKAGMTMAAAMLVSSQSMAVSDNVAAQLSNPHYAVLSARTMLKSLSTDPVQHAVRVKALQTALRDCSGCHEN